MTDLKTAIAQAVNDHQQTLATKAQAEAKPRQEAEALALETFKLPFDEGTIALLPTITYSFGRSSLRPEPIACFEFEGLTIAVTRNDSFKKAAQWLVEASQGDDCLHRQLFLVYEQTSSNSYSPEALGQAFLVFLHESLERLHIQQQQQTQTATEETGTFKHFKEAQKQRAQFIKAALHGTVIGLTSSGFEAGTSLQTALFAVETAEQVLIAMRATPLQRRVLGMLTLYQFRTWLQGRRNDPTVGSTAKGDHPVCHYLKAACGLETSFDNLAFYDDDDDCILGYEPTDPVPNKVPLSCVGNWLPELMAYKASDVIDNPGSVSHFTAQEILTFLEQWEHRN